MIGLSEAFNKNQAIPLFLSLLVFYKSYPKEDWSAELCREAEKLNPKSYPKEDWSAVSRSGITQRIMFIKSLLLYFAVCSSFCNARLLILALYNLSFSWAVFPTSRFSVLRLGSVTFLGGMFSFPGARGAKWTLLGVVPGWISSWKSKR